MEWVTDTDNYHGVGVEVDGGGALGRWQNSPVQTAASKKVIQSKETEWENNAIKLTF